MLLGGAVLTDDDNRAALLGSSPGPDYSASGHEISVMISEVRSCLWTLL